MSRILDQGLDTIWPGRPVLVGMIHLLPLPGSPRFNGSIDEVLTRAARDAQVLADAGFDGMLVENFMDGPFHPGPVPPVTVASMTRAVLTARAQTSLPVGVNVLRNDASAALSIAAATGARFIRVNVHVGSMWTDQGLLEGEAHHTLRLRRQLEVPTAVLADVHVKHATHPATEDLGTAASDAWLRGLADALIVSGPSTGRPAEISAVEAVRNAVPSASILIGSGLTAENAGDLLQLADGAIVGSSLMHGGQAGEGVDRARARALVEAVRGTRSA